MGATGKIYLLGGYPASRQTARTVQVYDIASNRWELGPPLPQPNNHGMAAGVRGKVYLIGGQTTDAGNYVDTVYELDPGRGTWVEKASMPTARSAGVAIVHDGQIYVAGGRPAHGSEFAVYDTRSDRTWTTAAPMLLPRSGMNGVMARGLFHVWGGEGPAGMFPDHDYYDPRTDKWTRLRDMPIPVHGVYGSAFVEGLIWASGGGTSIGGNFGSLHNQVFMPAVSCD